MEITSQDPNLALSQFNTKIQEIEENKNQPSSSSIIFWLLLFPPVALYKMWKYQKFHIWFPNLMIITALLNFPTALSINIPISGELLNSSTEFNINYNQISPTPYLAVTIIISIVEIILGIIFRKKIQKDGCLSGDFILISLFLMLVQYAPIILYFTNTLSGILSQTPTLNELEF